MPDSFFVFIPGDPRGKQRARAGNGRHYTPKQTVDTERVIGWEARKAMAGREPFTGPLYVEITAIYTYPASWSAKRRLATLWKTSKPDRDNIEKLALDALNKIVFLDDSQIADGRTRKHYTTGAPGLWIKIQTLD
jgi:Holliday junction resolvase RusA-like endonuclease